MKHCGVLLILTLLLSACSKKQEAPASAPPEFPASKPLSAEEKAEFEALGEKLARSIAEQDSEAFLTTFDHDAFARRIVQGMKKSEFLDGFLNGFTEAVEAKPGGIASGFLGQDYRFLRIRPYDGEHRIICRLLDGSGLNYHAYACVRDGSGTLRAVNFYNFATGENLSETLRRMLLPTIKQEMHRSKSVIHRAFSKKEETFMQHQDKIMRLAAHLEAREAEKGIAIYEQLPKSLREEKAIMSMHLRMLAIRTEDEDRYLKALEDYERLFPGDPSLTLMLLDFHYLKKDYENVRKAVQTLSAEVGGDDYLDTFLAGVLIVAGRHEEALKLAEAALSNDPTLEDAHWNAITAASNLDDYDSIARHLKTLRQDFDYTFDPEELRNNEIYQSFMDTPQAEAFFEGPGDSEP